MSSSGSGGSGSGSGSGGGSSSSGGGKKKSKKEKRTSSSKEQSSSYKSDGNGNAMRSFLIFDPNAGMGCRGSIVGQEISLRNPISALPADGCSVIGALAGVGSGPVGYPRPNPFRPPGPPIYDGLAARQAAFASGCKRSCCPCDFSDSGSSGGCNGLNYNGRPVILAFEKSRSSGGKTTKSSEKKSTKSKKTSSDAGTHTSEDEAGSSDEG